MKTGLALLLPVMLAGCASVLNKGNQSVLVTSTPPGALLFVDGKELGRTPYTYTLEDGGRFSVPMELRKEGHEPASFQLRPRVNRTLLFADAMLLGIPFIADSRSKALHGLPISEVNVYLYKEFPKNRQQVELPVEVIECPIPPSEILGRSGSSKLNLSSRELSDLKYPRQGTTSMLRGLGQSYVHAFQVQVGTNKGVEDVSRAKVLLQPVVKKVDLQLEQVGNRVEGTSHLEMEWRFYNGLAKDSLLFMVGTTTDRYFAGAFAGEVLAMAMQDAARRMLDEEGLYERLTEIRNRGLVLSKGQAVVLAVPKPIAFEDRRSMFPALVKAVVTVEMKEGHGSGFLITNDGYLLTNAHVVGDEAMATVRFEQGFSLEGRVVKVNRDFDLALIKVPGNDLAALTLGDDTKLMLGEELFAVGTPLDERLGQSISRGIMSGRRDIDGRKYLQTDVSINPGNSGGPLIDEEGRVVGIATMKVRAPGVEGIGFGVPITTALEMLNIQFGAR